MILIKIFMFSMTLITVKYIFIIINDIGDKKISKMKEIIDFADYLRIYSCDMKMSYEEILSKFDFKSNEVSEICNELYEGIKFQENKNKSNLSKKMEELLFTPADFNNYFTDIINYYGNTFSDVLDRKLSFNIKEMESCMKEYEEKYKDRKNLNNRISILVGCLVAIVLI